jgi:hypothetical protein
MSAWVSFLLVQGGFLGFVALRLDCLDLACKCDGLIQQAEGVLFREQFGRVRLVFAKGLVNLAQFGNEEISEVSGLYQMIVIHGLSLLFLL